MSALFADPALQAGFAVVVIFTPLSVVITGLRFWASRLSNRPIGTEDWLALGALICLLLWVVFLSLMAKNIQEIGGPEFIAGDPAAVNLPLWIASLTFPLNQLCAKLSILFLYHRIFGINRKYAFWIKAVGLLQIFHTIENVLVNIFQCLPIYKFWRPDVDGHCINYGPFLAINESVNSLIDFIMAI
ncbi:benzoate 4-monooxygenase cytochrome P450 [Paramyrothecium foliicola]|nr:benzoate 4-monooxygenase cytochrome P450 [Paramyrothecium foliicola]